MKEYYLPDMFETYYFQKLSPFVRFLCFSFCTPDPAFHASMAGPERILPVLKRVPRDETPLLTCLFLLEAFKSNL